ncbi:uncharacterized protein JN550_006879 [Neoarthrinium moseri]|uniref:uncharacterized protein n=1 Tax=Neoarthrinium moseri TaxID=1658444 RepID=UPI001FDCD01C|nr:uncharacterized protein JN550_006879 [Neoarthrinium moseri]KAI1867738.1 hypothetical protein JN550_006879 [Neoarthrinium moseri]
MDSFPIAGWIGLGSMGTGMAKNIQAHLARSSAQPLRVFNRTASRCIPLEESGARRCESIALLAQDCKVIFLSSSADEAVLSIVEQIIESGDVEGKIVVDTTTVHPDTSKVVSARLARQGAQFAAMPVFGASPAAASGTLLAAFAGPQDVLDLLSPLLKGVIAREVLVVGTEPEKALLLKTTGNLMMASLMQVVAEAHVFASKAGLPEATLERLLELNFGPVAYLDSVRMTTGVYCPGRGGAPWSDLNLAIKDVGHAIEIADKKGVSLKAGKAAFEGLGKAKEWANGEGKVDGTDRTLDSTSLYGIVRQESGLDFESDLVKASDSQS